METFFQKVKIYPPYKGDYPLVLQGNPDVILPKVMEALQLYLSHAKFDRNYSRVVCYMHSIMGISFQREAEQRRLIYKLAKYIVMQTRFTDAFDFAVAEGLLRRRANDLYEPVYSKEISNLTKLINVWNKKLEDYKKENPSSNLSLPTAKEMSAKLWNSKSKENKNFSEGSLRKFIAQTAPCYQDDCIY